MNKKCLVKQSQSSMMVVNMLQLAQPIIAVQLHIKVIVSIVQVDVSDARGYRAVLYVR